MQRSLKIKLSTAGGGKPFMKQLPGLKLVWGNCEFFINEDVSECDLWVVYGGLGKTETTLCPPGNTLFITNEPPSVKRYSEKFLKQFGAVMTCKQSIRHPNVIFNQQALPWWVGHKVLPDGSDDTEHHKTYDELKSITTTPKTKLLSVISSNKTFTRGHRERVRFVEKLKEAFGDDIDVFGIGSRPIEDKWDAIAPYKYHIVIENSDQYADCWTEKLADAYLAQSFPIYHGCPNLSKYFPSNAFVPINVRKPNEAIAIIKHTIAQTTYEKNTEVLQSAKNLILDTYQIFPMLAAYANKQQRTGSAQVTTLAPEKESSIVNSIKRIIKGVIRTILHG